MTEVEKVDRFIENFDNYVENLKELSNLKERVKELEAAKWEVKHTDTMNDIASLLVIRDSLEEENLSQNDEINTLKQTLNSNDEYIKRLEKALEFYANEKNYIDTPSWDDDPDCYTPKAIPVVYEEEGSYYCDCGETARKVLGEK